MTKDQKLAIVVMVGFNLILGCWIWLASGMRLPEFISLELAQAIGAMQVFLWRTIR